MTRAQNKTHKTSDDIGAFLDSVPDPQQRSDSRVISSLMHKVTKEKPAVWGTMVGFGMYHYTYASGREGDWPKIGFAPRKGNLTLYVLNGFDGQGELLAKLGTHTRGKVCLYIKRLADVDKNVLEEIIRRAWLQDISSISYG